jgi:hypothetical protein
LGLIDTEFGVYEAKNPNSNRGFMMRNVLIFFAWARLVSVMSAILKSKEAAYSLDLRFGATIPAL